MLELGINAPQALLNWQLVVQKNLTALGCSEKRTSYKSLLLDTTGQDTVIRKTHSVARAPQHSVPRLPSDQFILKNQNVSV